jgi:hypothetical protein
LYIKGEQWWPTKAFEKQLDSHRTHFEEAAEDNPLIEDILNSFGSDYSEEKKQHKEAKFMTAKEIMSACGNTKPSQADSRKVNIWLARVNRDQHGRPDVKEVSRQKKWLMPPLLYNSGYNRPY